MVFKANLESKGRIHSVKARILGWSLCPLSCSGSISQALTQLDQEKNDLHKEQHTISEAIVDF